MKAKTQTEKEENPVFKKCVEIWLKEIHPGWTFEGVHGKKMHSIIKKIRHVCKASHLEGTDDQIINSFRKMCLNLPTWFKDKDLLLIDSKFNEIITQIMEGKENGNKTYNGQPSANRVFGKYAY